MAPKRTLVVKGRDIIEYSGVATDSNEDFLQKRARGLHTLKGFKHATYKLGCLKAIAVGREEIKKACAAYVDVENLDPHDDVQVVFEAIPVDGPGFSMEDFLSTRGYSKSSDPAKTDVPQHGKMPPIKIDLGVGGGGEDDQASTQERVEEEDESTQPVWSTNREYRLEPGCDLRSEIGRLWDCGKY